MADQFSPTVTPEGSGAAQIQAASTKVATAQRPWDAFTGLVTKVPQAVGELYKQHKAGDQLIESRNGTIRAAELLAKTSTMSAKDRDAMLSSEYDTIVGGDSTFSDTNNKAFLSAITPTYFSAKSKAQAESNLADASHAMDAMTDPAMLPDDYNVMDGIKWVANQNNVDEDVVRNMLLSKRTDYYAGQIMLQDTPEGVKEVTDNLEASRGSITKDGFYTSKGKAWQSAIKLADAQVNQALNAVNKKFKQEALGNIATARGNTADVFSSYNKPFIELKEDFKRAYGDNPETYANKVQQYNDKVIESSEARVWLSGVEAGDAHGVLPDNKILKKEWGKHVTASALSAFETGDYERFIDIGVNDTQYMKDTGTSLMTVFNAIDDPVALTSFVDKVQTMSLHDNGATVLRQTISDADYVSILTTQGLIQSGVVTNIKDARTMMRKAAISIAQVNMPTGDKMNIDELAVKLGTQGPAYKAAVMAYAKVHTEGAINAYKDMYNTFAAQVTTKDDVKIDKSMSTRLHGAGALDVERTEAAVIQRSKDEGADTVVVLDNVALGVSTLLGTMVLTDIDVVTKQINTNMKQEAQERSKVRAEAKGTILGDVSSALDTAKQVAINQFPAAVGDFVGSIGTLVSKLGGHFVANWDEDIDGMREILGMITRAEASSKEDKRLLIQSSLDEFDTIIRDTVIVDPSTTIPNNTLSMTLKDQLQQTLEANRAKVSVATQLKKVVQDETYILTNLEEEEEEEEIIRYEDVKRDVGYNGGTGEPSIPKADSVKTQEKLIITKVNDKTEIKRIQKKLKVKADGVWGNKSQIALDIYNADTPKGSRIFASGKYQTIPSTLREAIEKGAIKASDKYDKVGQEKVMTYLLTKKRPQINKYITSTGTMTAAVKALSREWASFPSPVATKHGKIGDSAYGSGNKASTTLAIVKKTLKADKLLGTDTNIRALIAKHESGTVGINAYNQGTSGGSIVAGITKHKLSELTVAEVLKASRNKKGG